MAISTQNFFGVTLNIDLVSTNVASNPNWPDYRDNKLGASTWGLLPFSTEYFIGSREGQANDLPQTTAGAWTPPPYMQDLASTSITPWFRPLGLTLLNGDTPFPVGASTDFEGDTWQRQIKWRVGKLCDQTTPGLFWGILGPNEPERIGATPGEWVWLTETNSSQLEKSLVSCARAMHEQVHHSATGDVPSFTTCARRSSDMVLIGPVFAEPRGDIGGTTSVGLYELFINTTYLEYVDCIGAHHHQGMGNYAVTFGFNSTPPSTAGGAISLYHVHKAKSLSAYATHVRPHIYDESGLSMRAPLGSLIGWTATNSSTFPNLVDYNILDELRRLRTGSMLAGMLQWAPSVWFAYAMETGASDYLYDVQSSNQSPFPGWTYLLGLANWKLYTIANLTTSDGRTIPIPAKGSTDLSYLPTFSVRVDTNRNTQSSYGSPTPAFSQWSQSSFSAGLIKLTSGSTKLVDMYVSFNTTAVHTFTARVAVTGSTLGGVRLRAMGYHNYDGDAITQSTVAWGGESTQTLAVSVAPTLHGDGRVPGDPASALFSIMHNGIGTVFIDQIQIYASATTVCPYVWDYGAPANTANAVSSTLTVALPATYTAGAYLTLIYACRNGPNITGSSFTGIGNWSEINSIYSSGGPSVFIYGKFASSTDTGNLDVSFFASVSTSGVAKGQCISWLGVSTDTPYEQSTKRSISSLATGTTYYTCDIYQLDTYRTAVDVAVFNDTRIASTWQGETHNWTENSAFYNSSTGNLSVQVLYAEINDAGLQAAGTFESTGTNFKSLAFNLVAGSTETAPSGSLEQSFGGLSADNLLIGVGVASTLQQSFGGLAGAGRMGQDVTSTGAATFGGLAIRRGSATIGTVLPSGVNPSVYGFHMRGHRRLKASKFTVT